MEQHPIPRQVTTFEFKLIGFMTLKQFLYLVVFVPMGFIVWKLFPIPILNLLFGVVTILIGVAFAFLPINDRPLDVWVKNFYRRLTSPTQYTYLKHNTALYFLNNLYFINDPHRVLSHIESQEKLTAYLATTAVRPVVRQAAPGQRQQIQQAMRQPTSQLTSQPVTVRSAPAAPIKPHKLVFKPAVQSAVESKPAPVQSESKPAVTPEIQQMQSDAEEEARKVREMFQAAPAEPPVVSPVRQAPAVTQQAQAQPKPQPEPPRQEYRAPIRVNANPTTSTDTQAPHTLRQPFLTGVIKNNRKIPLPGVLVYLKDSSGQPIRLLKTNPHGVFATYNVMPPGDYTVEVKDPKGGYFFDTMKITVAVNNPAPFELYSKELL